MSLVSADSVPWFPTQSRWCFQCDTVASPRGNYRAGNLSSVSNSILARKPLSNK